MTRPRPVLAAVALLLTLALALLLAVLLAAGCTAHDPTTAPPRYTPGPAGVPSTRGEPPTTAVEPSCTTPKSSCQAWAVRAVDGDTLVVRLHDQRVEHVRVIGVDTPETHHPRKPVQCYGPEAAAKTAQLVPPGTPLVLETDAELRDHTPSHRLLAYVVLPNGHLLEEDLLAGGYARTLAIKPNVRYVTRFAQLQAAAKAARRGLWGACPAPTTTTKGTP